MSVSKPGTASGLTGLNCYLALGSTGDKLFTYLSDIQKEEVRKKIGAASRCAGINRY